jgi:type I restriction enzyme, S subunit
MVGEWKKIKLGDLFQLTSGRTKRLKDLHEYSDENPYPVYGGNGINGYTDEFLLENEVIVIGRVGEYCGVVHKTSGPSWITDNALYTKEFKQDVNLDFLKNLLEFHDLSKLRNKSGQPLVSQKPIYEYEVKLPTLPEQRKIAAILSSVDEAIEKTEAIIEQTEKVKKGLMQQLLTKGIGHTKFKKTEIGEIHEEWEVRRLDDIFEFYGGMPFSRSVLGDEGAFYLHYGDIHKMNKSAFDTSIDSSWLPRLDISKEEIREYSLLKTGDIVFADASEDTEGIGKSVVIINDENKPFISGLHTIIAKEKEATLDNGYKEYCFSNPLVRKQFIKIATGATVYGISKTSIKLIKIPVPPIEEQRTIAKTLKGLDNKIQNEKEKLEPLINIKKGLMQVLLTGKVRVKVDDEVMSQ